MRSYFGSTLWPFEAAWNEGWTFLTGSESMPQLVEPDLKVVRELKAAGGGDLKSCFQCATCSTVCNLTPDHKPFPRKEMILAQWGRIDELVASPDVWLCYQCNDCSVHCPRGARPGDVLAAVRAHVYKNFAFPSFMGKALIEPKALPALLLVPALIIAGLIFWSAPRAADGSFLFMQAGQPIDFNIFMPHSTVDAFFVAGNILIFIFAAIGFTRFWKTLKRTTGDETQMSFMEAAKETIEEIVSHRRFFDCEENKSRSWAHIIVLSGFVGAMITTGLVLLLVFLPHYMQLLGMESMDSFFHVPIDLWHPVKILGAVSGILLLIGSIWLIVRRYNDPEQVGASGYADNLFLWILFLTGLTGMMSWLIRTADIAWFAYFSYFVHLVLVYFLLWYMPYSKFAHMIYRTLALIRAKQTGRLERMTN